MPELPEWRAYIRAKAANGRRMRALLHSVTSFSTDGGKRVGVLEFPEEGKRVFGGTGALFSLGHEIAIVLDPVFGEPPVRKFTIAAKTLPVAHILPLLECFETGWG